MDKLKQIVEAALLAAGEPLTLDRLQELFLEEERPEKKDLRDALAALSDDYIGRGIEIAEVGGGFRINVREQFAPWVSRLWEERAPRYSRALMETLALIAYRQPITRSEIEEVRGVSVSSNIVKTLLEREWVRVVGTRDVPGKPSLYATTREFLNYFGLKSLDELPTLQQIRDLDSINRELELADPGSEIPEDEALSQLTESAVNLLDDEDAQADEADVFAEPEHLAEVIAIHPEPDSSADLTADNEQTSESTNDDQIMALTEESIQTDSDETRKE
ncbi:MAG: SMC-Scp complex subunit ScpB [Sedimenticola selenatireducens]|uniref:SMC-Scp complex subunit ScpB n=2 Tax=Sedimenticola selenatireducens TaxID=191960 RepID=A0A558DR86_9GAMM|nr:SMC-Scp complex subunit ScpB [Sedimenticola selenatireducens]TVO73605.1 SMC-Scp complex subunit ScpB [Sedimenticola selenatireducens]TVT63545.1 MAG: SMC-Scp complex subunit ScpB [Sedimenticola selenatireducens]